MWSSDGKSYYYLNEEDSTFNVYKRNLDGSGEVQLTHYKGNPVRFLTSSRDGLLCYGYNGEIYTLREGQQPKKIQISVTADRNDIDLDRQVKTAGATEIKVSPNGKNRFRDAWRRLRDIRRL